MTESNLPADVLALAEQVIAANIAAGRKIAMAESCTGGMVTTALTEVAGSSETVECGFVTYSNEAKQRMLGVSIHIIETFGAAYVSVPYKDAFAFLVLFGFLLIRPQGIFGEKVAQKA